MEWTRREREALARELAGRVDGEVRFRDGDRALYSTDASLYQVLPIGVVQPRTVEAAHEAIRVCLEAGAPVLPRGGGTSLAGQCVGRAVVVDTSRHLDRIVEIDPERRRAVVEPGVIQSHLNQAAGAHGLMFGPDTATANRATLGGMLGNNSAGAHSILYGKTIDHVRSVEAVLADGERHLLKDGPVPSDEVVREQPDLLSRIQATLLRLRRDLGDEIERRYPKIMRRVSGYNLDEVIQGRRMNLSRMLVGSEGSLGVALRMQVDLVDAPAVKGVALVRFPALDPAVEATAPILETGPSAVELMDEMLLGLAERHPSFRPKLWFLDEGCKAVQLVEYFADSQEQLAEKLRALQGVLDRTGLAIDMVVAEEARQVQDAWAIRKAGLPLLASIPTKRKPLPFVEDTAVDPDRLPEFVRRFKEVVDAHGTQAAYYAHASAGCLHIRPLLDLHDPADRKRMEDISEAIFELVCEFGGSMSGEHGDGRVRSHFNARLFGPSIYEGFREIKRAFDPRDLFNPGQVVEGPAMGDDLRWDFTDHLSAPEPRLSWEEEGGVLAAVEACNGTAACRKVGEGTMCPSYMAVREEEHSTRGRANLLRSALSGAMAPGALHGPEVTEAMELCLMCKACKSECPVKVDMGKLKTEWMSWKVRDEGLSPRGQLLSRARELLAAGARLPAVYNVLARSGAVRALTQATLGLDARRPLPEVAARDFRALLAGHRRRAEPGPRGPALLYVDTFSLYQWPEVALDALTVLEALGYDVEIPDLPCCGRPALGQGDVGRAQELAEASLAALAPRARDGVPIVGVEPGCLSMLWDDWRSLVPGSDAEEVAAATVLLEDLFEQVMAEGDGPEVHATEGRVAVHPHCHQVALGHGDTTRAALSRVPSLEVSVLGGGCCGMAGDFGHLHMDVSTAIWERTDAARSDAPLCVPGSSCRKQMKDQGKERLLAPATVLACALRGEPLPV